MLGLDFGCRTREIVLHCNKIIGCAAVATSPNKVSS